MGDARPVLMQLIDEKLLTPGAKKLYVSYYRKRVYADLLTDGSIRFKDTIYISPVPCALQMKRTLNPSLKTDAGWSTMFSAASGESLKDIKDRLNIRKRGPNSRTVNKDKKLTQTVGGPATTTVKPHTTASSASSSAADSARQLTSALQRCTGCKKDATSEFATCTACKRRTHFQCAHPTLEKPPSGSWFCDNCITEQANRILEFLNQTRRVLASHAATEVVDVDDEPQAGTDVDSATEAEPEPPVAEPSNATDEEDDHGDKDDHVDTEGEKAGEDKPNEAIDVKNSDESSLSGLSSPMKSLLDETALTPVGLPPSKLPTKERFIGLLDQLIDELSSKSERTDVITNSTGASLVHLAKTDLVSLVERGLAEIEKASKKPEVDEEEEVEDVDGTAGSNAFDVDELVRLFDLRHQVLQSKRQFEHITKVLVERGEQRLRVAETELMELEETRTNESNAVMKIANLIDQYTSDLKNCQERIRLNQVLLESVMQRRKFIRSSNVSNVFLPAYRLIAKHMITSSDQLLATVMLDKLRDIARLINEWDKMESHFETMSAKLLDRLESMKVKKEQEDPGRAPSPVPLFARIKIPPSRRLLERQISNYKTNLKSIADNRMRIRHTLQVTLKIAKDESLGEDVIDTTEILLKKCGGPIIVEEPEVVEKVEEIDDKHEYSADNGDATNEDKRPREEEEDVDQGTKRQRVEQGASEAVGNVSPVKAEPVNLQSSASLAATISSSLSVTTNTPAVPSSAAQSTSSGRVVEVMDSDSDSNAHASSDEASSPKITHTTSQSQQSGSMLGSMQSLESVKVKKELVEQATRDDFQSGTAPVPQRNEVPLRQQSNEPTAVQPARKTPATNGGVGMGYVNAWESQAAAPREQSYREPSVSLFEQVQQQQQQLQQQQQQLQQQLQQQKQQQQVQQRAQEQAKAKAPATQSRAQQAAVQQTSGRFPMPSHEMQQNPMRAPTPQMQVDAPKQRRETEQQRKNQRAQQQAREDVLRSTQEQQQQQTLPHPFQMPQSRQAQSQGAARAHQVSPVRDPFPQLPVPAQARSTPSQTFSALSDAHQPAEFGHQRHGLPSSDSNFQQQQQQQFQRYQQQQQQQQQHAGMLHGSSQRGGGASSSSHPLFGDMPKPPSMTSSNIPTPQELFGNHNPSHSSDESMGIGQSSRAQSVAARQAQQQQQSFQQQQQQLMHHLNPVTSMGQHHAQSHPLSSVGSMAQFNDPTSMRSTYLPSANDARATNAGAFAYGDASVQHQAHMMHHNDVFGQQQPPSMHHLFQNDVGARTNPTDFQAQFNSRLFRDPTSDNQMNHPGMDPNAPDMSEW